MSGSLTGASHRTQPLPWDLFEYAATSHRTAAHGSADSAAILCRFLESMERKDRRPSSALLGRSSSFGGSSMGFARPSTPMRPSTSGGRRGGGPQWAANFEPHRVVVLLDLPVATEPSELAVSFAQAFLQNLLGSSVPIHGCLFATGGARDGLRRAVLHVHPAR